MKLFSARSTVLFVAGMILTAQSFAADEIKIVTLANKDIAYDSASGLLYASVPSSGGDRKDTLTPLHPTTGELGEGIPIGPDPGRMAVSGDGNVIYVGLNGDTSLVRVDLPTKTVGTPFLLGADPDGKNFVAKDVEVVPGDPDAVVVARRNRDFSYPSHRGVALYRNGAMVGAATPYDTTTQIADDLEFGGTPGRLYASTFIISPSLFHRMVVDEGGVRIEDTTQNLAQGYVEGIDWEEGLLYTGLGRVIDPETKAVLKILPGFQFRRKPLVLADSGTNRLFYLTGVDRAFTLFVYDLTTLTSLGSIPLPNVIGKPSRLLRWGTDGLAFRTDWGQIHLIRSSLFPPVGVSSDLSVIQTASPDPANVGTPLTFTLSVTNAGPDEATGVTLTDAFPSDAGFVSAAPSQGTCSSAAGELTCKLGDLAANAGAAVTLTLTPTATGEFPNAARVSALQNDPDRANNVSRLNPAVGFVLGPDTLGYLKLPTNDLIYVPPIGKIVASIPARAGENGNALALIDPTDGSIGPFIPVGQGPNKLALSRDGKYLYVGLDEESTIRRVAVETLTPDLKIDLGSGPSDPLYAHDIEVLPDRPESVAVSLSTRGPSSNHYGIQIYDHGIPRTVSPGNFSGNVIAFGESPSTLYAYDNDDTGFEFERLLIHENGIGLRDSVDSFNSDLIAGFNVDIQYESGLLYTSSGRVIDPERLTLVGSFVGSTFLDAEPFNVYADGSTGRVFYLVIPNNSNGQGRRYQIRGYDLDTRVPLGSILFPGETRAPSSLIRWGADGLAFRTSDDKVFLARTPMVPSPSFEADLSVSATADPNPVTIGGKLTYTVTVTNGGPASAAEAGLSAMLSPDLQVISTTASRGSCAMSGRELTCGLGTLEAGASAQVQVEVSPVIAFKLTTEFRTAALPNDPDGFNNRTSVTTDVQYTLGPPSSSAVRLPARDLAYDARRGRLYASVAAPSPHLGTEIAVINPATGKIEKTFTSGEGPGRLALSGDGRYLYVGMEAGTVKRFDLDTLTSDLEFSLGSDPQRGKFYVSDMAVMAGRPETLIVARVNRGFSPRVEGTVVYDSGIPRPTAVPSFSGADTLLPTEDPERLYGHLFGADSFGFTRYVVGEKGITATEVTVSPNDNRDFHGTDMRYGGGYLFSSTGRIIDPVKRMLIGTFEGEEDSFSWGKSLIVPDTAQGRVYFIKGDNRFGPSVSFNLEAYDLASRKLLGKTFIPGLEGPWPPEDPKSLVRWGPDGVAFIGPYNQIFIARSPYIARVFGDVNRDRTFDVRDVIAVLQIAVSLRAAGVEEAAEADVAPKPGTDGKPYGDGIVNVLDAVRLLKALVGLEPLP